MSGPTEFAAIHDELRAVARDLLGPASPLVGDGGPPPPADWARLAEVGWTGLEVPEALGGSGATFAEVAVLLGEMGRATTVSPFLGAVVLGVGALNLAEPGAGRDGLLARAASGGARAVAVVADGAVETDGPAFALTALPAGAGDVLLDGRADLVPDVVDADVLLLLARDRDGAPVLVALPPGADGLSVSATPVVDATRSLGTVVATGVAVPDGSILRFAGDASDAVAHLRDRGALAVACDGLGLSRAMLDATVAYAGVRHQFGRPIGSFQAVKHACADMLVHVSVADELVRAAIDAVARKTPQASVATARAAGYVGDAAVAVAGSALQLHGGIGYAWESGVHVYLKRATLDRSLFGSPIQHRRRVAEDILQRARRTPV